MLVAKPKEEGFKQRYLNRVMAGSFGPVPKIESFSGGYRTIGSIGFNGEKTYGEIGPIKHYYPDYESLRARSWQLYLESELAQTVLNKYTLWVIGEGLKLQSEPDEAVLKSEGISINTQEFSKAVEAQFRQFCKSRMSDYADMVNLNTLEAEAYKNSKIGGDVLVILRFIDDTVKVQLIDGIHVQSPMYGSEYFPLELKNGNRLVNGIEIDNTGRHVAYYVRKDYRNLEYERVSARGTDSNAMMAYMVYGSRYRLDNHRGMPLLSVMFETAKKLERYKEAAVGSAEERAKIVFSIEHDVFSTGENPLLKQTVTARDTGLMLNDGFVPRDDYGTALADKIAVTDKKSTYNLPLGAHLKALESKNELLFKEFYETNIMLFCAAAGMPYEVAMSKYDSNYSASRGAMKDWERVLMVQRSSFAFQFMQPIYDFWLEVRILQKKLRANGYLKALITNDRMVKEAYRNARFIGPPVPHIDPEKEVKAIRLKLGSAADAMPLTTLEQATEDLSGGDSIANVEQFALELKSTISKGIKMPEPKKTTAPSKSPAKKPAKRKR